jgi:phage-related protein
MGGRFWYCDGVGDQSPPEVVFEGDSLEVIRSFPEEARANLGADLRRVQNGDRPLDSKPMAPVLPGVFELRDDDKDAWYRVFYTQQRGVVYVLHCFKKKTRKTPAGDIEIARKRLSNLKQKLLREMKD